MVIDVNEWVLAEFANTNNRISSYTGQVKDENTDS